jgi:hypothetical protein
MLSHHQGDQTSLLKITQDVAQPLFVKEKSSPTMWATSVILTNCQE